MRDADLRDSGHEALAFLNALYGEDAPGFLPLWRRQDGRTTWVPASELPRAAEVAVRHAEEMDVYFGIGLHPRALGNDARGTADDVIAIPGLWDDFDIAGAAHRKGHLPPTKEAALEIIGAFPLPPSAIVDSGHGLQPWWLLKELWIFDDDTERRDAQDLAYRFQATLHVPAAARGWTTDSTHDLARVLRPPGTWNRKLDPVPVRLMLFEPSRRYSVDDIEPFLLDVSAGHEYGNPRQTCTLPTDLPAIDIGALRVSPRIRALIAHGWDAQDERYESRSEAVFAVVQAMVVASYDDAVIASVLLDPRNGIGEKPRQRGRRWVAGELTRARAKVRRLVVSRPAIRRPILRREVLA